VDRGVLLAAIASGSHPTCLSLPFAHDPPSPQAWDAREAELAALHERLTAACAEVAEPLSADFADGIGARMTQARADAYAGELAAVAEVKAARAAEIEELCKEVAVLWADIESAPPAEDELASAAVSGGLDAVTAAFGWGASVIADLQGRLTALQQDVVSCGASATVLTSWKVWLQARADARGLLAAS